MQRFLVGLAVASLCSPAWAGNAPIGILAAGTAARIRNAPAIAGGSIFSGDRIVVAPGGSASLVLGNARVLLGGGTAANITNENGTLLLTVSSGQAAFSTHPQSPFAARVGTTVLQPAGQGLAVAALAFHTQTEASFYVEKGEWVATDGSGRSVTLHAGERIELVQNSDQNNRRRAAGLFLLGTAIAGTATGVGLAFGMAEDTISKQTRSNAVSPTDP